MIRLNLWDLSLKTPPSSSARFSLNFFRHILPFLTMSRGCTWISRFFSPPILGIFSERFFLHRERGCKRLSINRREAPFSIYGSFFLFFFFFLFFPSGIRVTPRVKIHGGVLTRVVAVETRAFWLILFPYFGTLSLF